MMSKDFIRVPVINIILDPSRDEPINLDVMLGKVRRICEPGSVSFLATPVFPDRPNDFFSFSACGVPNRDYVEKVPIESLEALYG